MFTSPNKSLRFLRMRAGRIAFEKSRSALSALRLTFHLAFRPCAALEFGQAEVWCRLRRRIRFLLRPHRDLLFDEDVVTEKGGAAKDDDREKQNEKPLHEWERPMISASSLARAARRLPLLTGDGNGAAMPASPVRKRTGSKNDSAALGLRSSR